MTVRRIMGIETEYGIAVPGQPWANPIETSGIIEIGRASCRERV